MDKPCICAYLNNKYSLKTALGQIAGTKSITQNKIFDTSSILKKWINLTKRFLDKTQIKRDY